MKNAKEFLEYVIQALVDDPNCFRVEASEDEKGALFTVVITKLEAGRIIGKKGAVAQSLRTLLRGIGGQANTPYFLKVEVKDE